MNGTKTPLPKPKFFPSTEGTFSTKKVRVEERVGSSGGRWGGKGTGSVSLAPRGKTAPAVSRVYPRRWADQRPHFISFKAHSDSLLTSSRGPCLDDSQTETSYLEQAFVVEKLVGVGCFGEVFRVKSREDGHYFAVKRAKDRFRSEADRAARLREVQKHEALPPHPNLVRFIRAWEERGRLYIQTELCRHSLDAIPEAYDHAVPENLIWNIFADLLLAVFHLHQHDLLHLDIKPENIFISQEGFCKLGDFGLVFDLRQQTLSSMTEGDAKYLSPELLHEQPSKAADIFSLGITLLEMACDLDVPNSGLAWHMLRQHQLPSHLMARLSPALQSVIASTLEPDPLRRPSAADLLALPELQPTLRRRRLLLAAYSAIATAKSAFLTLLFLAKLLFCFVLKPFTPIIRQFYNPRVSLVLLEQVRQLVQGNALQPPLETESSVFLARDSPTEERWMGGPTRGLVVDRVAQNLRFEDDDDEDEEDEGLGDVGSLPGSVPGSGDVLSTDDDESAHHILPALDASDESQPSSPPFSSLASLRRRPFNSTPANQAKKRSRLLDPCLSQHPAPPPPLDFSPVAHGDCSPLVSRLAAQPRRWSPLLRSSPEKSGGGDGGGDCLASLSASFSASEPRSHRSLRQRAKPSPRKLRLAFDQHGSSSEDEF